MGLRVGVRFRATVVPGGLSLSTASRSIGNVGAAPICTYSMRVRVRAQARVRVSIGEVGAAPKKGVTVKKAVGWYGYRGSGAGCASLSTLGGLRALGVVALASSPPVVLPGGPSRGVIGGPWGTPHEGEGEGEG